MSDEPKRKMTRADKRNTGNNASPKVAPLIEPPAELGPVARKVWDRLIPRLFKSGLLTAFDEGPLAIYCTEFGYWLEATDALQKFGTVIKSPNGYPVQSPYVSIARRSAEMMMKIADEYGFLPHGHRWGLMPRTKEPTMPPWLEAGEE